MVAAAIAALAVVAAASPPAAQAPATITASGTAFHVDGRPAFLLGVSLFDALGTTPPRDADLDALVGWGVRIVRVWAHWEEPIYQGDGALTPGRAIAGAGRTPAPAAILVLVLLKPANAGAGSAIFQLKQARARGEGNDHRASAYRNIFDLFTNTITLAVRSRTRRRACCAMR